jgi:hypothetical protein
MPGGGKSLWDSLRSGAGSEETEALNFLFPAKNKFEFLQMLTDQQPRAIIPWSVLGIFRDKYKSKTLRSVQYEHNVNKIAQERKGRLEGSEVVVGIRRSQSGENDD